MGRNKDKEPKRKVSDDEDDEVELSECKRRRASRGRSSSPKKRLPQQRDAERQLSTRKVKVSNNRLKVVENIGNENNSEINSQVNRYESMNNNASMVTGRNCAINYKQKARRNLIKELDAIDAEFDEQDKEDLIAPDGIQITVNRKDERELFEESEEDETIYPADVESDAETVAGENYDSVNSSAVISFKMNSKKGSNIPIGKDGSRIANLIPNSEILNDEFTDKLSVKKVSEMSPDELMEANPALKRWMEQMLGRNKSQGKGGNKQTDVRNV